MGRTAVGQEEGGALVGEGGEHTRRQFHDMVQGRRGRGRGVCGGAHAVQRLACGLDSRRLKEGRGGWEGLGGGQGWAKSLPFKLDDSEGR